MRAAALLRLETEPKCASEMKVGEILFTRDEALVAAGCETLSPHPPTRNNGRKAEHCLHHL